MRALHPYWASKELCPYNWRRLWEACALAQVAVESTHVPSRNFWDLLRLRRHIVVAPT